MEPGLKSKIIKEWAGELPEGEQIIRLFEKVRDIPYGDIGSRDPTGVYKRNKGTCSGKHELLKELYQELGIEVKDCIAIHKFNDLKVNFPGEIRKILNRTKVIDPHNFLEIFIGSKWVNVDATWDTPLKELGFPVNENWDGKSSMKLCVVPIKITEVENALEAKKRIISELPTGVQEDRKLFLKRLTDWLDKVR